MLDASDPRTEHVFEASRLLDELMAQGQLMTVSPSPVRTDLMVKAKQVLDELRGLNAKRFGNSSVIAQAIVEYELGLSTLAGLSNGTIETDRRDGAGACPACGTPIMKFSSTGTRKAAQKRLVMVCSHCSKLYMPAHQKLESETGFGTWAI